MGGKSSAGRGESYVDGVKGLKALGVKEMTYKMLFIACSVIVMVEQTRHGLTISSIGATYRTANGSSCSNACRDQRNG